VRAGLAAGGAPALCLVALLAAHQVRPLPGLAALALTAAAAIAAAVAGRRRQAREAEATQRRERLLATREAESALRQQAAEALLERLPDLLLVLGRDGGVRRANAAARAAFGADMAAVLRQPGLRGAIEAALARPQSAQNVQLILPVPVRRDVQATVLALDPPLPGGGHLAAVLSDRTRERTAERIRADFVANASHELRTPLTSLIGFIETLRGAASEDPAAQQRFLGIMAEQAQRMNRLIDDLLSLSRIELTEHQAPDEVVDLGTLLHRVAALFEPRLQREGAALELDVPADLPPVLGDADQIEQVAQNLVDNALKYGAAGGPPRVQARVPSGGPWPRQPGVVLAVADRGRGIPHEHIARLTERFYRVDAGRSRRAGGTGLGLAIVKHIVNRHRGQLLIESTEGLGSTFSVWLPQAGKPPISAPSPPGEP
jgi:two-component system phosphate regulon sensor histidine kinase PhoR